MFAMYDIEAYISRTKNLKQHKLANIIGWGQQHTCTFLSEARSVIPVPEFVEKQKFAEAEWL
jgi:hypothetical protein